MWNQRPCFRFEIDNFSEKEAAIASHAFVSGGCEWYIFVNPKGIIVCDDQLPLCLAVPNPKSLGLGWERRADYYWVLLNQSDKVLYKTPIARGVGFCAETTSYAIRNTLPLSIFQEKGFLDNDKLIIEVYIKVTEAFDGEGGEVASQVNPVRNILRNACSKLSELAEVGFKLDWWKSKLGEVSSEWKKVDDSDESRVQELEERTKKLQLMASKLEEDSLEKKKPDDTEGSRVQQLEERVKNLDFKLDCFESKLEESPLERKPSSDTDGSRVQQLEERFNDIVKMVGGFRLDFMSNNFTSKLEGVKMKTLSDAVWSRVHQLDERLKNLERMAFKLEKKTSDEGVGSRVQQLEETLKNLELMELGSNLSCVKSKLEEVSLERKKSDDANGSLAKTFQERLENLELRVLDLIEMNKKKAKSCDDFLLVDEVA